MTGYTSKRKVAQDKMEDDDIQTYQRPWVGLTDKHVFEVLENLQKIYHRRPPSTAFAKAIEAKLKKLNT